jgi:hydrocephalus-inducing protein
MAAPSSTSLNAASAAQLVLAAASFNCPVTAGILAGGASTEVSFVFTPSSTDRIVSWWLLDVREHNLQIPFLLRGLPLEPDVTLAESYVDLPPVLVGTPVSTIVTLINRDAVEHAFSFNNRVLAETRRGRMGVAIEPLSGVVPAGSSASVNVRLTPNLEQATIVHLQCDVASRAAPLPLAFALEGFRHHIHVVVGEGASATVVRASSTSGPGGSTSSTLSRAGAATIAATAAAAAFSASGKPSAHEIALGAVPLGDRGIVPLTLVNSGRHPVEFDWIFPPPPVGVHGPAAAAAAEKAASLHARRLEALQLTPTVGSLAGQSSQTCQLGFAPSQALTLGSGTQSLALACRVAHGGPHFSFKLSGSGVLPAVQASVSSHDFGTMLLHGPGHPEASATITLSNNEPDPVDVACTWANTVDLRVTLAGTRIAGRGSVIATVVFTPREARAFAETLVFVVNSTRKIPVKITGRGVPLRLSAVDASPFQSGNFSGSTPSSLAATSTQSLSTSADANAPVANGVVSLGTLQAGESVTRVVKVTNHTPVAVTYRLAADFRALAAHGVRGINQNLITLGPKDSANISVVFAPTVRIPPFRDDIGVEVFGSVRPLFSVMGSCQARNVALDNDQLSFGTVVAGGRAVMRVSLANHGDLGSRFQWRLPAEFTQHFTLTPMQGYLTPGLELACELTCHPAAAMGQLRFEGLVCELEAGAAPLLLDVTAIVVVAQPDREPLSFLTAVRASETKTVKIVNPSATLWRVVPTIDHPFFTAPPAVSVPPGETVQVDVTYTPLTMTQFTFSPTPGAVVSGSALLPMSSVGQPPGTSGSMGSVAAGRAGRAEAAGMGGGSIKDMRELAARGTVGGERPSQHSGTLFVPLPDGNGVMIPLTGVAQPPRVNKLGGRDAPCKQWYVERVPVSNWLSRVQRFRVQIIRSKVDAATSVRGPEFLEVPALGTAEYPLEIFAHRESTAALEVVAMNEATGEFSVTELSVRSTPPGVLDTINLSTRVRQSITHSVTLSNPLPVTVTVAMSIQLLSEDGKEVGGGGGAGTTRNGKSSWNEVQGPPTFKLPARCVDLAYAFEFLPLVPHSLVARLTLSSAELGVNVYNLQLVSTPALPLPPRMFSAALGDSVTQRYRLVHYTPARTDMTLVCSEKDFIVPPTINAAPAVKSGSEVFFDVTFEPGRLGECRATITVSSPLGGEYVCPLVGQGLPPSPSGPHAIKAGGKLQLPFKNVLSTTETFTLAVDNPAFTVADKLILKAGETKEIVVKHEGGKDGPLVRALLSVTCISGPIAGTTWPHYLVAAPGGISSSQSGPIV